MVHVYRDRVLHTVVPLDVSPAVYEMTADDIRQSIEQLTAPGV